MELMRNFEGSYKTGKIFYHTKWNELCLLWFKDEASFKRLKNSFKDCYFIGNF